METVLITGGAGFIGSHVCEALSKNYKIIVIDNLSNSNYKNISNIKNVKFYNIDIENDNLDKIFREEHPDYVIHLAAQVSVGYSVKNPYLDAKINILSSIKLLDLCKKYNIKKIISASTAAVYGNSKYLPVDENHPKNPFSPYGLSKYTMEKYIESSGVPYIIFRFSNVYGPGQKITGETGVIAIFEQAMSNGEEINIFGDGSQVRDFIYVEDIAKIFVKAVESNIANQILNFSSDKGITINELFTIMSKIYDYKLNPIYKAKRDKDIEKSILANKQAKLIFQISDNEFTDLETGLKKLKTYNNSLHIKDLTGSLEGGWGGGK